MSKIDFSKPGKCLIGVLGHKGIFPHPRPRSILSQLLIPLRVPIRDIVLPQHYDIKEDGNNPKSKFPDRQFRKTFFPTFLHQNIAIDPNLRYGQHPTSQIRPDIPYRPPISALFLHSQENLWNVVHSRNYDFQ